MVSLIFLTGCESMKNQQKENSTYILKMGGQGASNLDLQNAALREESIAHLERAGLSLGMTVWDIGCGSGAMTEYLSETVGPEGLVYALDVSEDQIQVARHKIESKGLKNVHFIVGDINKLETDSYKKADIVYSRFLIMHVHDPANVIKIMSSLLKPGGRLCLQESTMGSIKESKTNPALTQFYDLIVEYGTLKGFDYSVGRKLEKFCRDSGLFSEVVDYKNNNKKRNPETTEIIKKLILQRLDELEDKLLSSHLINTEKYEELKKGIREFFQDKESDDAVIMNEISHVVAYKN